MSAGPASLSPARPSARRDGPFGDYSRADPGDKPDPGNVIEP